MRTSTVVLAGALSAMAIAAPHEGHDHSDTVDMFLPMADGQVLLAYEVGSDATATTWIAGCPRDADSNDCGFPIAFMYTGGPKTAAYTMSGDMGGEGVSMTANCDIAAATASAVCTIQYDGPEEAIAEMDGITSTVMTFDADYMTMANAEVTIVTDVSQILGANRMAVTDLPDSANTASGSEDEAPNTTEPARQTGTGAADDEDEDDTNSSTTTGNLEDLVSTTSSEAFAAQITSVPFVAGAAALFMAGVAAL